MHFHSFLLRLCPHCYAAFFPASKTMAFRNEIHDKTREIWLSVLEKNKESRVKVSEDVLCIDHGQKLIDGALPDYGIPGKVSTCCDMFHLPPELLSQILKRTLVSPSANYVKTRRTSPSFFLVQWMTALMRAFDAVFRQEFGSKEEDPFESMQYDMKFKDVLGPRP